MLKQYFDINMGFFKSKALKKALKADGPVLIDIPYDSIIIFADKKDKYGRIDYDDESGFVVAWSKITSLFNGKEKNMFTRQKRSRNKFSKIVNGNRL